MTPGEKRAKTVLIGETDRKTTRVVLAPVDIRVIPRLEVRAKQRCCLVIVRPAVRDERARRKRDTHLMEPTHTR
jgi:hypothetical protein